MPAQNEAEKQAQTNNHSIQNDASTPALAPTPPELGVFATRPLQLRLLTGFVLALALIAWLTGWILALVLGYDYGWDFEPFKWGSRLIDSPDSSMLVFVISSYAALASVAGFCAVAGLRPALKPNLWLLVSLAMACAALLPFTLSITFVLFVGDSQFLPTALVSYLTMLPLLPATAWVVNHRFSVRSKQLLKTSCVVFATLGTMLAVSMVVEEFRTWGSTLHVMSQLLIIMVPVFTSLGLFGLTLFLSRNLYKTQLRQLAGTACIECGYDLQGLPEQSQTCPECGSVIARHQIKTLVSPG